ncbi:MAG: hypothetical protein CM1200mP35_01010 [Chloroflexota bacterium]|nr:MAG: hypothetical protein CM1200mP35_01010 [Chloroflexota bacterium]
MLNNFFTKMLENCWFVEERGPAQGDDRREMLWPKFVNPSKNDDMVPLVRRVDDIHILVAGGAGGAPFRIYTGMGITMFYQENRNPLRRVYGYLTMPGSDVGKRLQALGIKIPLTRGF